MDVSLLLSAPSAISAVKLYVWSDSFFGLLWAKLKITILDARQYNSDGAKGGRKVNPSNERNREAKPASVPTPSDKQAGENLWQLHKAERGVWSEKMLRTLVRGVKGGKWFSLIDKVYADATLSRAWEK